MYSKFHEFKISSYSKFQASTYLHQTEQRNLLAQFILIGLNIIDRRPLWPHLFKLLNVTSIECVE